jgi:hypothetical protein
MQPAADESAEGVGRTNRPRRFWRFITRQPPEGAPATGAEERQDFVLYPVGRVVGTVADAHQADATVEALLQAAFERRDIEVLRGEEGLRRLDPAGPQQGLLAQVQRSLVSSVGDFELISIERHVQDLRRGKLVVMARVKGRDRRRRAAEILSAHGAEFVGYYGRWFWELLDTGPGRLMPRTGPEPAPGQMHEVNFDGTSMRLRFQSGASAIVTAAGLPSSHAAIQRLRPGLNMLCWKTPDGTAVVQVHDYESSRVYAVLTERDGSLRRLTGTIRRLT